MTERVQIGKRCGGWIVERIEWPEGYSLQGWYRTMAQAGAAASRLTPPEPVNVPTHWAEFLAMAIEAWREAFTNGVRAAQTYRLIQHGGSDDLLSVLGKE